MIRTLRPPGPDTRRQASKICKTDLVAGLLGLAAAWIAGGATGLLAHPLRHALTWLALGGVALAVAPRLRRQRLLLAAAGFAVAAVLTATSSVVANLGAVAIALSAVATAVPRAPSLLRIASEAAAVLTLFYFARTSIPFAWQAADATSTLAGRIVGSAVGNRLWVGSGFGGIDYLVVMSYLAVMIPFRVSPHGSPPTGRLLRGLAVVLGGHLLYLALVASIAATAESLTTHPASTAGEASGGEAVNSLQSMLLSLIPWNLPALGLVIQLPIAGLIYGQAWRAANRSAAAPQQLPETIPPWRPNRRDFGFAVAGVLLAVALAVLVAPSGTPPEVSGKKIVLYEKGFLNWLRPTHAQYGRLSGGMYGMLPTFLESLGAETAFSDDLSQADLQDADVLVLIFPNEPWEPRQLENIWNFVRRGGSLLLMGEHTVRDENGANRFNEVLEPTALRVRFDSATFAVGGWLQSYETLWHPTTAGLRDAENDFGVVIGASVHAPSPARPLVVGRWGWADPGDPTSPAAMMGNGRYDAGERLGDVVLAAEQALGDGRIVVFGDTSGLSNGINIGCHPFNSRLFAYLCDPAAHPLAAWRDLVAVLMAAVLVMLLATRPQPISVISIIAALALSAALLTARAHAAWDVVPDGRYLAKPTLAYIDGSHLGDFSRESWRPEGLAGISLTLMRNGYLTLMLPEVNDRRLNGARLLLSVAPSRAYTPEEQASIIRFVERGGIFICTAGNDRAGPAQPLLHQLGFRVGTLAWSGNRRDGIFEPLGHFKSPYFNGGDYLAHVRFHAAWPIECTAPDAVIVTQYPPDKPLILARPLGRGRVVVIGDSSFVHNRNLEHENGEPFEGMRENAHFWRWFLPWLSNAPPWYPPPPEGEAAAPEQENASPQENDPTEEKAP